MLRSGMLVAVAGCLLASVLLAREGVVRTHDGQAYEGRISEREGEVLIVTGEIESVVPAENVQAIEYVRTPPREYQRRLEALDEEDFQGRIELAREAFDDEEYELSLEAVEQALRIDPEDEQALLLRNTIREQIELEQRPREEPPAPERPLHERPGMRHRIERRLLSLDDINTIRQMERRPGEPLRVRFEEGVRQRFVAASQWEPREFHALSPLQQAEVIFREGHPDLHRDVRILSDPAPLLEYRRIIQPVILAGCAASACHGGPEGGDFVLYRRIDSDAVTYTNFFILQQYTRTLNGANGPFDPVEHRMIDRLHPAQSLLADYGLARTIAGEDRAHPDVPGFRPIYRNRQDPRYRQLIAWMGDSLITLEPDYGIEYEPPVGRPPEPMEEPALEPVEEPVPLPPPDDEPVAPPPLPEAVQEPEVPADDPAMPDPAPDPMDDPEPMPDLAPEMEEDDGA